MGYALEVSPPVGGGAGGCWKGFGWGPTLLNVLQAARYEAGSAVCGKNGRTDGEVLSRGAASLCREWVAS